MADLNARTSLCTFNQEALRPSANDQFSDRTDAAGSLDPTTFWPSIHLVENSAAYLAGRGW
jgi:hypothetical protein